MTTYACPPRDVGHLTVPGYRAGNSPLGDIHAVENGDEWVDRDLCYSADRVPLNTHGPLLSFDKFASAGSHLAFSRLTWERIAQLVSPDGYRVRTMYDALANARHHKRRVEIEAKTLVTVEEFRALAAHCELLWGPAWRAHVNVKCLTTQADWQQILRNAHTADFPTIVLVRGGWTKKRINEPWATYVRGSELTYPTAPKETTVASRTPKTDALIVELRRRGVEVITQEGWDAKHIATYRERLTTRPHALLPGKPVDTLWNHISVTLDDGKTQGNFAADVRELERIGMDRFGTGISYNVAVDQNADRPRIAMGQFLEAAGAHTVNDKGTPGYSYNQNKVALAVVWVGVPGDKLNEHAVEAMVQLRAALITIDALTDHYDDVPHSLVAAKDCPTDELRKRLPDLKKRGLAAVKTPVSPRPPAQPVFIDDEDLEDADRRLQRARDARTGADREAVERVIESLRWLRTNLHPIEK